MLPWAVNRKKTVSKKEEAGLEEGIQPGFFHDPDQDKKRFLYWSGVS
jgi:hypothetical protein